MKLPSLDDAAIVFTKVLYNEETKQVNLVWRPATAKEVTGFYVERSRNGQEYKQIGFIEGSNSPGISDYDFSDINPYLNGYYRLYAIYDDGVKIISQTINVVAVENGKLLLSPNPTVNTLRILFNNMGSGSTDVVVYDLYGRTVINQKLRAGEHDVNIAQLPRGTFVAHAIQDGKTYKGRFIKN